VSARLESTGDKVTKSTRLSYSFSRKYNQGYEDDLDGKERKGWREEKTIKALQPAGCRVRGT
jgi:hypothetical protein